MSRAPQDVAVLGGLQQFGHMFFGHELRQALVLLGRTDRDHRVVLRHAAAIAEFEEASQCGELAGHGGLGIVVFAHELQVAADVLSVGVEEQFLRMRRRRVHLWQLFDNRRRVAVPIAIQMAVGGNVQVVGHDFRRHTQQELAELA